VNISLIVHEATVILSGGAEATCITLDENRVSGRIKIQVDRCRCLVDREGPVVAGHIPVQLIVLLEISEHAICPVAEHIGVLARLDKIVGSAEIRPYVATAAHRMKPVGLTITQDSQRF